MANAGVRFPGALKLFTTKQKLIVHAALSEQSEKC